MVAKPFGENGCPTVRQAPLGSAPPASQPARNSTAAPHRSNLIAPTGRDATRRSTSTRPTRPGRRRTQPTRTTRTSATYGSPAPERTVHAAADMSHAGPAGEPHRLTCYFSTSQRSRIYQRGSEQRKERALKMPIRLSLSQSAQL